MGWIIFGGIVLLLALILMIPVHVTAGWDGEFSAKVRWLFLKFTVFPMKEKKEEQQKEEAEEEAPKKERKPKKKKSAEEIIDGIVDAFRKYRGGVLMILHNVRIHRLEGSWKVAADDAAACAIRYGRICAFVNGGLAALRNLTRIETEKLRIYPDFTAEKEEITASADVEANPLIVLIGGIRIGFVFLKDMFSNSKNKKHKKRGRATAKKKAADTKKECA